MYSALGLVGFGLYASAADDWRRWAATLVVVNGVLYHRAVACGERASALFCWDVACNAALAAWINATSARQPWTAVGTAAAVAAWPAGHAAPGRWGHLVHVLGVQCVLLACLATAWPPRT